VGCGGGGEAIAFVGNGHGDYIQETTFRYVGHGGDYGKVRKPLNLTLIGTVICCLVGLLVIPLLCWLGSNFGTTQLYNCNKAMNWEVLWPEAQKEFCCTTAGVGCSPTTQPATAGPTSPPTPPPTQPPVVPTLPPTPPTVPPQTPPHPPADPFNCAVGLYPGWVQAKQQWCCDIHHICGQVTSPRPPADPFNCAVGFENWQAGWTVAKKQWCCSMHGKGCVNQGNGCATQLVTTQAPYDCNAGFANWMVGWSAPKKSWCCTNAGKGCATTPGGCA